MHGLKFVAIFAIFIKVHNAKYIVQSLTNCANSEIFWNTISASGIEVTNDKQYIRDLNATIRQDVGSNGRYTAHIASGKSRFPLTFKGPNVCVDIKKYLGEMWMTILESLGVPTTCPIKKGIYTAKRVLIDESKIPFKVPIKGLFHLTINSTDTITKRPLICLTATVKSV